MKTSTKIVLASVALLSTLGFGGLIKTVNAQQLQSAVATMPQHRSSNVVAQASDSDGEANDATEAPETNKLSQSVDQNDSNRESQQPEASDGDGETNDDVEEQQEAAKLQPLAKITAQQAQQAAQSAVGGQASKVELENEDGNLVYEVKIGQQEVIVDAGNGRVLYSENENQENEKNEASRPKSSIQVPSDDGEANDRGVEQQRG